MEARAMSDDTTIRTEKRYLTRDEATEYLNGIGYPIAKQTLAQFVTTGGGPRYRKAGARALYTIADLDEWANERLGKTYE